MTIFNDAVAMYFGNKRAESAYLGGQQVWTAEIDESFYDVAQMSNLVVLAGGHSDYDVAQMSNLVVLAGGHSDYDVAQMSVIILQEV